MPPLKVVALISGGKDSLFSILHCIANGHDVIALANLHPPLEPSGSGVEDMDSFMYQTVGHAVLPLYEAALGLPLYRQEITGSAVNMQRSYGPATEIQKLRSDETEALVPLLKRVKATHPELNAVSTGAILSDYQRTRVESVALRLGLTPVSYLWQWPNLPPNNPSSLLMDMAAVGQDSRIIKVASGGLDESFLWQNVADKRTIAKLSRAAEIFGSPGDGAVLGEGGEYETLAISGPAPLWKRAIEIADDARIVSPGEAGTALLRLKSATLRPLDGVCGRVEDLRVPPILDEAMEQLLVTLSYPPLPPLEKPSLSPPLSKTSSLMDPNKLAFSSLTAPGNNAAAQMTAIMEDLGRSLLQAQPDPVFADIAYTSLILRDMADFAAVNKAYGSYFTEPDPPARVTIACADVLPVGSQVMLSVTLLPPEARHQKKGLHVQSRSYWAPANIGPYSQAISVPSATAEEQESAELVYVSGQIPLIPATMELCCASDETDQAFTYRTLLALQHMLRVGNCMKVVSWAAVIAFIATPRPDEASSFARKVSAAWMIFHDPKDEHDRGIDEEDDGEFDVWYLAQQKGALGLRPHQQSSQPVPRKSGSPPLWIIQVDALPRGADVEWVGYGSTGHDFDFADIPHLRHLLEVFRDCIV